MCARLLALQSLAHAMSALSLSNHSLFTSQTLNSCQWPLMLDYVYGSCGLSTVFKGSLLLLNFGEHLKVFLSSHLHPLALVIRSKSAIKHKKAIPVESDILWVSNMEWKSWIYRISVHSTINKAVRCEQNTSVSRHDAKWALKMSSFISERISTDPWLNLHYYAIIVMVWRFLKYATFMGPAWAAHLINQATSVTWSWPCYTQGKYHTFRGGDCPSQTNNNLRYRQINWIFFTHFWDV